MLAILNHAIIGYSLRAGNQGWTKAPVIVGNRQKQIQMSALRE
jgi:hypothetical protein